jgi:hypothetical protein
VVLLLISAALVSSLQASSVVHLSSTCNACSRLPFPLIFLKHLSDRALERSIYSFISSYQLTCSSLFNLLSHDGQDRKYCQNDFFVRFLHGIRCRELSVSPDSSKEMCNACEDIGQLILVEVYRLGRLMDLDVTMVQAQELRKILTESRTPMATNTTFAGERSCKRQVNPTPGRNNRQQLPGQHPQGLAKRRG